MARVAGSAMAYPRVIPHSDGAGVVDAVGGARPMFRSASGSGCMARSPTGRLAQPPNTASRLRIWWFPCLTSTVVRSRDLARVDSCVVAHAVALDQPDPASAIRAIAPQGAQCIVEVALSDNADLDAAIVDNDAVIAAYATRAGRPELPFWPMLFNVTIRLLGSDDFSAKAKKQAAQDLTTAATAGALGIEVGQQPTGADRPSP